MILDDIRISFSRAFTRATASGVGNGLKSSLHWSGVPLASALLAAMSEYDHFLEKEQLTKEYLPEIAAKMAKSPNGVTLQDMETLAQSNPLLSEALTQSRTKRNVSIGVNIACTFIAFALATHFGPILAGVAAVKLVTAVCTGIVGFVSFMASEKLLSKAGKNLFNLNEPSLQEVEIRPLRQNELSTPGQIRYLEGLQEKRIRIFPSQVETVFRTAGRTSTGEQIAELTELLNSGQVRAQELAFALYQDKSGVLPLESAKTSRLEEINSALAARLEQAQAKIGELSTQTRTKAGEIVATAKDKADTTLQALRKRGPFNPARLAGEREGKASISPEAVMQNRSQPLETARAAG